MILPLASVLKQSSFFVVLESPTTIHLKVGVFPQLLVGPSLLRSAAPSPFSTLALLVLPGRPEAGVPAEHTTDKGSNGKIPETLLSPKFQAVVCLNPNHHRQKDKNIVSASINQSHALSHPIFLLKTLPTTTLLLEERRTGIGDEREPNPLWRKSSIFHRSILRQGTNRGLLSQVPLAQKPPHFRKCDQMP